MKSELELTLTQFAILFKVKSKMSSDIGEVTAYQNASDILYDYIGRLEHSNRGDDSEEETHS